jgi:hypothetical protein
MKKFISIILVCLIGKNPATWCAAVLGAFPHPAALNL